LPHEDRHGPSRNPRRNLIPDDAHPSQGPSGIKFEKLSHHETLAHLDAMMDYAGLRAEQERLRKQGICRGLGTAFFVEVTNPSAAFYGVGGAKISAQDGCTFKLDAQGNLSVHTGRQRAGAGRLRRSSRRCGILIRRADRARARRHGRHRQHALWRRHLGVARGRHRRRGGLAGRQGVARERRGGRGAHPAGQADTMDIRNGFVVDKDTGTERIGLDEVRAIAYFRPDTLPPGFQAELVATRHYVPRAWAFSFTNGAQASWLEVDTDTGFIKLLKHWCVEDCGTVINPQLVDEQVRGGIVQGLGAALFEHCLYDERGQMLNGNMADYLVPMAAEMPDIEVGHVVTPTADSELGAKGAGEAGTAGAPAAVMNAVNDALAPLGRQAHYRDADHAPPSF
jgi:carbon-monoxide dehydrogenase large subunit